MVPWRCQSGKRAERHERQLLVTELTRSRHANAVREMFSQIAGRYDLMNRLMSAGQDLRWRRLAVRAAELQPGDTLLDVAAGTGDMAFIAQELVPGVNVVAADFAVDMMRVGRRRKHARPAHWIGADTYRLPFPDGAFDAVTSAFLLRNLTDPLAGIREQARVLKPGGRLVALDATPPPDNFMRPAVNLYLNRFFPVLGALVAGQADAYRYLPRSIAGFLRPGEIGRLYEQAGLGGVWHRAFMAGTAAMVVGTKGGDLS
jgi:demethylmenaquinone methyltransferase/2-methoxy-6-polyprenyl-1,4-benzoquinol methylase